MLFCMYLALLIYIQCLSTVVFLKKPFTHEESLKNKIFFT